MLLLYHRGMEFIGHVGLLLLTFVGIWVCAGFIVRAVDSLARRLRQSSFAVAFLLLGLLTSIAEISVAINSTLNGTPHLSVGNLVGGALVIFLLIIPVLAIFGGGVRLHHTLHQRTFIAALGVIALASLVAMTGVLMPAAGVGLIGAYGLLLVLVVVQELGGPRLMPASTSKILPWAPARQLAVIAAAGLAIFFISNQLVEESVWVAQELDVPASFIGLLILSVGTNTPEIMIAVRAILFGRKEVAFGNYLGSAAMNTLILGCLAVANGRFVVDRAEFVVTAPFVLVGLGLFYRFSRTRNTLSAREGVALGLLGLAFVATQLAVAWFAR